MHLRHVCAFTLLLWVSGFCSQLPEPETGVQRLIDEAMTRNRELLAAQERIAEARGMLHQAAVRPAPTVEATAASGRPLKTPGEEEYSVGYFQPIETGGKRSKRLLLAERGLALAEAEFAEHTRQLAYDIKTQYIEAVISRRKAEAIERIVGINRESYRLVDARVQRDDAAPLERGLVLVELNRTEAQQAAAEGQAQTAEIELRRRVGFSSSEPVTPRGLRRESPIALSVDGLQARALLSRPDLKAAQALLLQAAAEVELARAQGSPDLTLSAQYTRRSAQFEDPLRKTASGDPLALQDRDNVLSFGVSIPLQTRKRNLGNIEAAIARVNAAKLRVQHLGATIPLAVAGAWRRYQAAERAAGILRGGVLEQSERNLTVIRQAYNLGQLRLLDVLNEQRRLLETELTYIDAESELARSRAELERAVGGDLT